MFCMIPLTPTHCDGSRNLKLAQMLRHQFEVSANGKSEMIAALVQRPGRL
jgi:hypothetical protein